MKKIFLLLAAILLPLCLSAAYQSLLIKDSAGKEYIVNVNGLSITFSNGNLVATNNEGSISIAVDGLSTMEFVEKTSTVIEEVVIAGTMEIYTISGEPCGTYTSAEEASASLPGGIYIVKYQTGLTAKLLLNK